MSRRQQPLLFPNRAAAPAPAQAGHRPLLLVMALAAGFATMQVRAQPAGAQAAVGTATLTKSGANLLVTTTNGPGNYSAINWQSFSVPGGSVTQFAQPGVTSTSINRVIGAEASLIYGRLSSNGRLVLVNTNGITVGAGAVVDTAAFTASTLRMSDADFLAGRMRFADPIGGLLKIDGEVLARSGDVVLIGQKVETGPQAVVESPQGATILAAGQKVEVTGRGLEGIVFEVQAPSDQAVNLGTLRGDAVGVFAGTLRHSGLVQAQAVTAEGGRVVLKAVDKASVTGGSVQAAGAAGKGGNVDVFGGKVELTDAASIDASGANGGGSVRIGGDYQGANTAVQNAQETFVSADSQVRANASANGDGGRVIVWADDATRAYGRLEAKAGPQGGDGGLIETSGKRALDVNGISIDASSAKGAAGMWLLDPSNITVVHGTLGSPPGSTIAPLSDSTIIDATLTSAIDGGTNVTVTTAAGNGTSPGDITFDGVNGPVQLTRTAPGARSIGFIASRDIVFANGTTNFDAAAGSSLEVVLSHGGAGTARVQGGASLNTGAGVHVTTGGTLAVTGGSLQVGGTLFANTLEQSTGALTINGVQASAITFKMSGGSVHVAAGELHATSFLQSGGSFDAGGTGNLSVDASFSSTGGTFGFHGTRLGVLQTSGNLVIPAGADIMASGLVDLKAANGDLTVNRTLRAGEVDLGASGALRFGQIHAGGLGGNVGLEGASVGTSGAANAVHLVPDATGNAGRVLVRSTSGGIEIASINALGGSATGSGGDVTLSATGGNITLGQVDTRAANGGGITEGGRGGNVSLTSNQGVTFAAIRTGGSNGGDGGNVTISGTAVASGSPGSPAQIDTSGQFNGSGLGYGSKGGDVEVTASNGNISLGSVVTQGGGGSLGNGSGGAVTLAANNGQISVDLIRSDASMFSGSDYAGHAGDVSVTTTGSASVGKILLGAVSAQGAFGGGSGGNVTIWGAGDVSLDTARVPSAFHAVSTRSTTSAAAPASSGSITIGSDAGHVTILGNIESAGDANDGGAIGAIRLSAAAAGKDVSVGAVSSFAQQQFDNSAPTRGGNITITAGRDIEAGNLQASGANAGRGGNVVLQSGGRTHVQQVSTDGGTDVFGSGGAAGNVTATAGGNLALGSLFASGGDGDFEGGAGGNVSLSSAGGFITTSGGINAIGGNASINNGGNGGTVRITATGGAATSGVMTGPIAAYGGAGSLGSRGGDVTITSNGDVEVTSPYGASVLAQGGNGLGVTGSGGNVTLASTGGKVKAVGVVQSFAGYASSAATTPSLGGAGGSVDVRGTSVELGPVLAWGSTGTQVAGRGGNVNVAATGGNLAVGHIDTRGFTGVAQANQPMNTTLGGAGGHVTLSANGGSLVASSIVAYGGGSTTVGSAGGNVRATATGSVTAGQIRSFGGRGDQNGNRAGDVTLASTGGSVSAGQIDAQGGWGSSGTGGAGGNVSISGQAGVQASDVLAYGGTASNGGTGGHITIASAGGNITAGELNTQAGGSFSFSGPAGSAGTVGITGGGLVSLEAINTLGGSGSTGTAGGNIIISAAGDITFVPSSAFLAIAGGGGFGSLGSGGAGATVTLASSGGNVSLNRAEVRGGFGQSGGIGGKFSMSAPNGTVAANMVDASGGSSQAGNAGMGGNLTITSGTGVVLGELYSEGGHGAFSSTLGSAGGQGGNISVTVSQGDLDLSTTLLGVEGGRGGDSDSRGGTGGTGGRIVVTATSGAVLTSAEGVETFPTELLADGGKGGSSVGTSSLSSDRGGTGGVAGSIVINSGSSASLLGDMSAAGGTGGSARNSETAQALGGTGGAGGNGSITVNVTGAGQTLTLGGRVRTSGGDAGLANLELSGSYFTEGSAVAARAGAAGTGVGSFAANAGGGVFIPSAGVGPSTGTPVNLHHSDASLAIDANWTNSGALALHSGAWVLAGRPLVNNGAVELGFGSVFALGTMARDGVGTATFTPGANTLINGSAGVVRGFGTVDGNLVNQGIVSPGMSFAPFGQLAVTGHYTQTATGQLVIHAESQGPYFPGTNHDQLRVLGAVTLGGSLVVHEMVLPSSQVTQAVDGPAAVHLAQTGGTSVLFLDAAGGIAPSTQFASITAPANLRSLLEVQNGATLQTVDGLIVAPPAPTPSPPAAPVAQPVASPTPAPAPAVDTTNASLVNAALELVGQGVTRETVQEALTVQQASVASFTAETKNEEKKAEKKEAGVVTTDTSCKAS